MPPSIYNYFVAAATKAKMIYKHAHGIKDQDILLYKLNIYLTARKRKLASVTDAEREQGIYIDQDGYCSGLSTLWNYKMSEHQEDTFYRMVDQISNYSDSALSTEQDIPEIEKFLARIEWCQNPELYSSHDQDDVDSIAEVKKNYSLDLGTYSISQLTQILKLPINQNNMVRICSDGHALALQTRGNDIYLYDANNPKGRAKKFSDYTSVVKEIAKCLDGKLNLELSSFTNPFDTKKRKFFGEKIKLLKLLYRLENPEHPTNTTALFYMAIKIGDIAFAKSLQPKADPFKKVGKNGETAFHMAIINGVNDAFAFANTLLNMDDAKLEVADDDGRTPLHLFAQTGRVANAKQLIEKDANIYAQDKNGKTPLYYAYEKREIGVINLIVDIMIKRQEINTQIGNGITLLHIAIECNLNIPRIRELIILGVPAYQIANHGKSAIACALEKGRYDIAALMLIHTPKNKLSHEDSLLIQQKRHEILQQYQDYLRVQPKPNLFSSEEKCTPEYETSAMDYLVKQDPDSRIGLRT